MINLYAWGNRLLKFVAENKLLIFIFIIGISVRIFHFGEIPPGLNQDEASNGYDTYAMLHYGIDRNGIHNPVMTIGWGSGEPALPAYLSMPFIRLLGLNAVSIRLVNLIFGLATLFVFYLFTKEVYDKKIATLSLFLLAISPWHILMSRWDLTTNLFPAFFLIASLFLVLSIKKHIYLPISLLFFALSLFIYGTAYFVVPIFLLISCAYLFYHKKINLKAFAIGFIIFLVVSLPLFLYVIINVYKLSPIENSLFTIPRLTGPARFQTTSTLWSGQQIQKMTEYAHIFINLLIKQDDGWIWNSMPPYGFIYTFSLPFTLIGILVLVSQSYRVKNFGKWFFLLIWLILSTALGFLTYPVIQRINIIFLPIIICTALGIRELKTRRAIVPIILLYCAFFASFSYSYFHSYPAQIGAMFYESLDDAINYASDNTDGPICITGEINQPYIFVLFYRKIDPHVYISTVKYGSRGEEFEKVLSFDRYNFYFDNCKDREDIAAYVFVGSEGKYFDDEKFFRKNFKYFYVAIKKDKIKEKTAS